MQEESLLRMNPLSKCRLRKGPHSYTTCWRTWVGCDQLKSCGGQRGPAQAQLLELPNLWDPLVEQVEKLPLPHQNYRRDLFCDPTR